MGTAAEIVLAGGRSARMGAAKADLECWSSTIPWRTAVPGAVTLNGLTIPRDERTPLVTGDTITFS